MDRKRNLTGNLQIITREALASLELKFEITLVFESKGASCMHGTLVVSVDMPETTPKRRRSRVSFGDAFH